MKNFVQPGNTIDTVLVAAANTGDVVIQGTIRGVAAVTGNIGDTVAVDVMGVFTLAKASATVFLQGDKVAWDGVNKVVIVGTATGNLGFTTAAAGAGATVVNVRLCPGIA
jgi:predicted RecA/RadA family phage recombinase